MYDDLLLNQLQPLIISAHDLKKTSKMHLISSWFWESVAVCSLPSTHSSANQSLMHRWMQFYSSRQNSSSRRRFITLDKPSRELSATQLGSVQINYRPRDGRRFRNSSHAALRFWQTTHEVRVLVHQTKKWSTPLEMRICGYSAATICIACSTPSSRLNLVEPKWSLTPLHRGGGRWR